ncbi:MAG: hypothetical protein AB1437_16340 [Pseudomonadota bacterium]
MPELSVPESKARQGVKIATNQQTTIQVRLASIELLVGGPYEDHPYGHVALRVTTREGDQVFDYGRYGRTWGVGSSEGEGILNIWNSFPTYINGENALGRVTTGFVYETTEESANKILAFYEQKIAGKKPKNVSKVKKSYVIDTYYALGPNCTTLSVSATKVVFPDIDRDRKKFQEGRGLGMMEKGLVSAKGWPDFIFMPADLQAMLLSPTARKAKAVNKYGGKR